MKVLYFYRGRVPTDMEKDEAKKIGAIFRSRMAYRDGDFVESCDGVAGDYPEAYAKYALKGHEKKPVKAKQIEDAEEAAQDVEPVSGDEQDGLEAIQQVLKRTKKSSS